MTRRLAILAVLLTAVLVAPPATGQSGGPVTLDASSGRVTIGDEVTLSGSVSPATAGQTVTILDEFDVVVGTATTGGGGGFSITIRPDGTRSYRAEWNGSASDAVRVQVRAIVTATMTAARLFGDVTVRGTAEPVRDGASVHVTLVVGGRVVDEADAEVGARGRFTATLRAETPGAYRARASYSAPDLLRDVAIASGGTTPLPPLHAGSRGPFVELLEARLVELHYRLAGAGDGLYDGRTADAVVAFHKVQGMARTFTVDAATWRRLADPRLPRPRRDFHGFHVEVDQTRQVLYTVEDGRITNILHVSTGAGGATRDGTFRVYRKLAGFSPNRLYYPSYFDGLRALHGWTEVPTYAASHGCVRIPYWNATWVYDRAAYGTRVVIYH